VMCRWSFDRMLEVNLAIFDPKTVVALDAQVLLLHLARTIWSACSLRSRLRVICPDWPRSQSVIPQGPNGISGKV